MQLNNETLRMPNGRTREDLDYVNWQLDKIQEMGQYDSAFWEPLGPYVNIRFPFLSSLVHARNGHAIYRKMIAKEPCFNDILEYLTSEASAKFYRAVNDLEPRIWQIFVFATMLPWETHEIEELLMHRLHPAAPDAARGIVRLMIQVIRQLMHDFKVPKSNNYESLSPARSTHPNGGGVQGLLGPQMKNIRKMISTNERELSH